MGGVDADRGVVAMTCMLVPPVVVSLPQCLSVGVKLCGRELLVIGVGGSCDGEGLAKGGDCCLRGLGELELPLVTDDGAVTLLLLLLWLLLLLFVTAPGLVVPAS